MKYDVFISYRRDGGEVTARILRDSLTERGYKVFFDVESLRSGSFNTKLYSVIDECEDFVLILSPNALDRCSNSDDWVRRETEYALEKKKNVIPIMLRNFQFPDNLPESLSALPMQNGLVANLEYYEAFLDKLEEFLKARGGVWKSVKGMGGRRAVFTLVLAAVLAVGGIFGFNWFRQYPRTEEQINLTQGVVANVGYNLSYINELAKVHQDILDASEKYLITGEAAQKADRFQQAENALNNLYVYQAEPTDNLLNWMKDSPFNPEELSAMHNMTVSFREETIETLKYMEFITGEECMLSKSDKLRTVELYQDYLEQMLRWFAHCTNEMLLPVNREQYLDSFWSEILPYMGRVPLDQKSWSRDKQALVEAGNECYENLEDIQMELALILGNSNMELQQEKGEILQELLDAGYFQKRAEKIVDYMSRDWEAELTPEEVEQKQWELDVMLKLSVLKTDDLETVWTKMTYLLDLDMYEEAKEAIALYQVLMTNAGGSERYMSALTLYSTLKEQDKLDFGIMVMAYYEEDGINDQLMIGDILYSFNGEACRTVADYLAMKEALTGDSYVVKVLRLDENNKMQTLELTLATDSPRVYLNDLTPTEE